MQKTNYKLGYDLFGLPAYAFGLEDEPMNPGGDPTGNPLGEDDDDDEPKEPVTTDRFQEFERFYRRNMVVISLVQFLIIILLLIRILNK